jgi:hypothetical protein
MHKVPGIIGASLLSAILAWPASAQTAPSKAEHPCMELAEMEQSLDSQGWTRFSSRRDAQGFIITTWFMPTFEYTEVRQSPDTGTACIHSTGKDYRVIMGR